MKIQPYAYVSENLKKKKKKKKGIGLVRYEESMSLCLCVKKPFGTVHENLKDVKIYSLTCRTQRFEFKLKRRFHIP